MLDRIRRKFATAATLMPKPEVVIRDRTSRSGVIYFGATRPGVLEGLDLLARDGVVLNSLRLKGFPFSPELKAFCDAHDRIFVIEQNRDAQMRSLLMVEAEIPGDKLIATLSYDGMPLTAQFVHKAIFKHLAPVKAQAAE
jgi:2-oxoglutarate ferredoxin oxidoreductase subunit alpha